jgi:hypothetical protein
MLYLSEEQLKSETCIVDLEARIAELDNHDSRPHTKPLGILPFINRFKISYASTVADPILLRRLLTQ